MLTDTTNSSYNIYNSKYWDVDIDEKPNNVEQI